MPFALILMGISTALSVVNAVQSFQAAEEAEAFGREKKAAIEAETQEEVRRERRQQAQVEGQARAVAAGSGFEAGSFEDVIGGMTAEHERQLGWIQKAGAYRGRAAEYEAKTAADQARSAGWGALADAAGTWGMGYKRWWG